MDRPPAPGGARTHAATAGRALIIAGAIATAHLATYGFWRRWCLEWGSTAAEARAVLPGDELLETPGLISTRSITINAEAGQIWPWLVQMGPGRAGAYTYDWIENLLGLDMHSADMIIPAYQQITVGDSWHLGERGPVLRVARLEPEHALVLRSDDGHWIWAFVLQAGNGTTRLVSRNRITTASAHWLPRAATRYLMEPGSLVMERKMLLGIKERAECAALVADQHPPRRVPASQACS
jgi:hypothetical protein